MENLKLTLEDLSMWHNKTYNNNPNDTYMINHHSLGIVPSDGKYKCMKPFRFLINNNTQRIINIGEVVIVNNDTKCIKIPYTFMGDDGVEEFKYPSDVSAMANFRGWFDCFIPNV